MKITTQDIINSVLTINECSLRPANQWFENGEDCVREENEYAFFDVVVDGAKVSFSVSIELEATCRFVNSGGDGWNDENYDSIEDVEATITISEPYSEDAEIAFDLNDTVVHDKLMKLIEKAIY